MEKEYPKISIVTPSYNQGKYIEETILSILDQKYPNLEYFIIDGGSTDGTVEIIKKYQDKINFWVSEPDEGQSHAINKGLAMCTGDIFNWINSDDILAPNALFEISIAFKETGCDLVAGCILDDFDNSMNARKVTKNINLEINNILKIVPNHYVYHQPGVWFKKSFMDLLPKFSVYMHYHFDWDYTLRYLSLLPKITYLNIVLVHFRVHPESKTISVQYKFGYETEICYKNLFNFLEENNKLKYQTKIKFEKIKWNSKIQILIEAGGYNINTLKHILGQIIIAPRYRFTRFTLGQLRIIINNLKFKKD